MLTRSNINYRGIVLAAALIAGLAATVSGPALAEDQNGGVPGDWLSRYMGPRSAGIGGAFVATVNEPTGAVWNPAGLSLLSQNQVYFESAHLFESTSIRGFSLAVPGSRFPSFGLSVLSLSSGEFERTNELNEPMGDFSEGDMAFVLSSAKSISPKFSLGVNLKVVRQTIEEFDAAGVGFDVGLMYNITPAVRIGTSLLNVGGPNLTLREVEENYPVEFRGGLALSFFSGRGLISGEIDHVSGIGSSFHAGTEFWIHPSMGLRFGYAEAYPSGGFSYNLAHGMRFDYAATDHDLGVTHRVGLSYRFGGYFASSEAVPSVFSPIGQQSVTKFQLKAKTKSDAETWSLEIVDKSGLVVRKFSGKGTPPAHIMWDGKDETGLTLPDGIYRYQLAVLDRDGREMIGHPGNVEITTDGPQGTVPVFTGR